MKEVKKVPNKQLEKFSNIFTQLSLVLVLFIVYVVLEFKTDEKPMKIAEKYQPEEVYSVEDAPKIYVKESSKEKIKKVIPKTIFVDKVEKGENNVAEEFIDALVDVDEPLVDVGDQIAKLEEDEPGEITEETVSFIRIEEAPIFKGCEGLTKKENRKCFEKKIKRFIISRFDIELANELNLRSGLNRIHTQFVIAKDGSIIDIKVKAPHKRLEKEVRKIINKLPKFTPGKQRSKPVKVRYSLPIAFQIE